MSGPICPDCNGFSIQCDEDAPMDRCAFCGWSGRRLPRKKLHSSSYDEYAETIGKKLAWRKQGALFFLRLHGELDLKTLRARLRQEGLLQRSLERPEVCFQSKNSYAYVELHTQPSPQQRATLESWPGVERMSLT